MEVQSGVEGIIKKCGKHIKYHQAGDSSRDLFGMVKLRYNFGKVER